MSRHSERTLLLVRLGLYLGVLALAALALERIALVVAPVAAGLFLAYVLDPPVARLVRRGVPRPLAVLLLLATLALVGTAVVWFVTPLIASELVAFKGQWHAYVVRLDKTVLPWLRERLHLPRRAGLADALVDAFTRLGSAVEGASSDFASAAANALDTARGFLRILVAVVVTPVFAVYFLLDWPRLVERARALVPPRLRPSTFAVLGDIDHALTAWLRGQLLASLVLATCYATGLWLVGIPLGVAIGLLTGLLAFVPYVGVVVGLACAVLIAVLDYHGAGSVVGVLAVFAAVQTADAFFITPRIVGGRVGLSPPSVIFALALGGRLFGYPGLLLAMPGAAVVKVLLGHARKAWYASAWYRGGQPEVVPTSDEERPRATG